MTTKSSAATSKPLPPWWKESVIYQIYPASFFHDPSTPHSATTDANTVGNIRGLISKIPYIASLGFDCLWLSPIFTSPQNDMGYDIADYRDIHAPYGTVDDVQKLVDTLHATIIPETNGPGRKMRLLMDLVVNHTSSEHPWFIDSASSITNPKSDWYFWRDPKVDSKTGKKSEPNNWKSIFGGPAWHYVESRKQYYLALFLPTQPDLNWANEEMRQAIYSDMRFWLDRGVDGWRIDSMNLMSKHPDLPDAKITEPNEKYQDGKEFYASGPKMHEYLQEMREEVFDKYDDAFTVGEMGSVESEESVAQYVAESRNELNCVFQGMDLDFGPTGKYDGSDPFHVSKLRNITNKWQVAMPKFRGWNSIYLDNHDSGRSLTRYASDLPQYRIPAAKMLATYLCTLSGTVFALAGQEIGMANLPPSVDFSEYIDVECTNHYSKTLSERGGHGADMSDVMAQIQLKSRDHGRLPMQWNQSANAGFCEKHKKPWMMVNPELEGWTVEDQENKEGSVLEYWKRIIRFRREYADALVHGGFRMLGADETGEDVIGYERTAEPNTEQKTQSKTLAVLLNFSKETVTLPTSRYDNGWKMLIGNLDAFAIKNGKVQLRPYEAVILSEQK